jgi:hypothetical protein
MITIDGTNYDIGVISITRKASHKLESLGTTMDLKKHYDIQGTYYDYEVEFYTRKMNVAQYDLLYDALTTPVESHEVTLPYGQSTITFNARTQVANDKLLSYYSTKKKWGSLKVTFEALEPEKEA